MKTIDEVDRVGDLEDGASAFPSPDLRYDLREISGDKIGVTVERVERREADLYAICGERSFRVTGRGGWVLCPKIVEPQEGTAEYFWQDEVTTLPDDAEDEYDPAFTSSETDGWPSQFDDECDGAETQEG